jgi:hypothetical protein
MHLTLGTARRACGHLKQFSTPCHFFWLDGFAKSAHYFGNFWLISIYAGFFRQSHELRIASTTESKSTCQTPMISLK